MKNENLNAKTPQKLNLFRQLLRIHAFWQFYGYKINITAFYEFQKYRLVGDICNLERAAF